MTTFIIQRLLSALPTLLATLALVFALMNLAPGDPVEAQLSPGQGLNVEQRAALRHQLGLDRSAPERFLGWLGQVARGDLGHRYKDGSPVLQEIVQRLPATLMLTVAGLGVGTVLGMALGLVCAACPGSRTDRAMSLLACIGISTPAFLLGIVAMHLFALSLGWLPSSGYASPGDGSPGDVLRHLILPAGVLSVQFIAILMRYTRSSVLEVRTQDYMRTARAKGLSDARALIGHAFPNALIPIVTVIGANVSALVGGAVFVETVFSWPGLGMLFVDGIEARDYPLIMGITLFMAMSILVINLVTDLVYAWIDPRITLR